jgi:predicted enzyme related to lactoylglutathione lyase
MSNSQPSIASVMVHVPDTAEGLAWYARAFPSARRVTVESHDFQYLELGAIRIEVVQADDKVAAGPSGTVVYWQVSDLEGPLRRLLELGATLYRGPMAIENGQGMCQVRDPWGNCLGLRGRWHEAPSRSELRP